MKIIPGLLFTQLSGCLCLVAFAALPNLASAGEAVNGKALLIGIQDYAKASPLPGVAKDVRRLGETLAERGGYEVQTVVNSSESDDPVLVNRSERDRLQQTIDAWLAKRTSEETILLYFSSHGFRDDEGRMHLALVDFDPADPKPGGIPVAWLREKLIECAARSKLLVLDACHAGSARSASAKNALTAKELGHFFRQTEGLVTLASSSGKQKSHLWPEKGQSLFTYWLVQGICGHADREPLGEITVNELDDYVTRKVRQTAERILSTEQTPTRLQGPGVTQDVVIRLQPTSLKSLLDDMAEQMDVLLRLDDIRRVGIVPEFASGPTGQVLGGEYGDLATYCPVELANRLATKGGGDYRVVNTNAVREALQSHGIAPKDLGTAKSRDVSMGGQTLSALVAGQVISLRGGTIALRCQALDLATGDIYGIGGGTARLCASELAMQGASGRADAVAARTELAIPAELELARIDATAEHPLRNSSFPYRARIVTEAGDGKMHERTGTFRGNDYFVTLRRGEAFHIQMVNRSDQPIFVRVLVDGLNTLPEKSQTNGAYVVPAPVDQWRQAQPVNLAEARAWGPLEPDREYSIRGFYSQTGANAVYDEFKVVDATKSLAAEAGYTDQLGLITVAFYEPKKKPPPGRRTPGVGRGQRYRSQTETYGGPFEPGRLLAVAHIRYGE